MELKFEITEDDYIKFNLYNLENSTAHKKTFNLIRYAIPILLSGPIYFVGHNLFKQPTYYWIIISIMFVLIWVITYPKQYKYLVKKETKKILQEGDNSSVFGEKILQVDKDSIKITGELTSETISRKSVQKVKIYEDMILIYMSGFTAQIIPTRYLEKEIKENFIKELMSV